MRDVITAIWRVRWIVLVVFISVFALDFALGVMRMVLVQGAIFLFGVVVGRLHRRRPSGR